MTHAPDPIDDIAGIWPDYRPTPLVELAALARQAGVGRVFAKLENERPLGNFKSLGGMLAGLRALSRLKGAATAAPRLICASEGNHGLAVAAAAARAGVAARIYLCAGVARARVMAIEACGGEIVTVAGSYDDAVLAAADACARGEGLLIADTAPDATDPVVRDVMAGYAVLAREIVDQLHAQGPARATHLFVQAGVGGLAAAAADGVCPSMTASGRVVVVEPAAAACVAAGLAAGRPVQVPGDLRSCASMLSCGLASAPALEVLLRHRACPIGVAEDRLQETAAVLRQAGGPDTTPSGAAGFAGLLAAADEPALRRRTGLEPDSVVVLVVTEARPRQD